ncbi:hypothetical protein [Aestuariicoccus sp. MJ-SS9]|uniref:hypothetical protein n=1 Tax=Aestuariicoccus sp. MJ-SS9 TaxID=3079855 RepID=UPI00290DCB09|nr:hypothetical protein [Aestuariicoccus sp. MJ-SS9]MDU8911118.1 hypothetical protein [Aestuariicoccus sp. MJ-SS9]
MSDTDSFIDEVSEEVRRDRLFALMRRYGWIAVLLVVLVVGGAAFREYSKASDRAAAQAFGDSILAALEADEPQDRVTALAAIEAEDAGARAVLRMLIASEEAAAGNDAAAVEQLNTAARDGDLPEIYREIASFKALVRSDAGVDERRIGFEALAIPGNPLRLLAEEQLALIAVETGDTDDAIARLQRIIADAEVTSGLRRRASQLIVALGGTLEAG